MSEYDLTFDPNKLIGHCDLISRFSDFALYLDTQLHSNLVSTRRSGSTKLNRVISESRTND